MSSNSNIQTVVIIPAFNEALTASSVVQAALRAQAVDAVIVVDDGSTDTTSTVAQQAAIHERELGNTTAFKLGHHATNRGKSEAMQSGVKLAKALAGDTLRTVVFLDADLSAIQSRNTPQNRYLHQSIADKLLGRDLTRPDEIEAANIKETFLSILASHIDRLIQPVHSGKKVMTIAMLARNFLADKYRMRVDWGMLSGNRAVSLDVWDAMLQECLDRDLTVTGWEIEAALNSYTRLRRDSQGIQLNKNIEKLLMTGVVHVGSRYKARGLFAGIRRMATIQVIAARAFVKYAVKLKF